MNRTAVVLALAALAGCRHKRWIDVHATELHVNGLVAPIPEGWRDAHELTEPVNPLPVPGTRTLILDREDAIAEIDVMPLALPIRGDQCEQVAKQWETMAGAAAGTISHAEDAVFAGDHGCIMEIDTPGWRGKLAVRTHDGHTVIVRSLYDDRPPAVGDTFSVSLEAEYAFYKVLNGLRSTEPSR